MSLCRECGHAFFNHIFCKECTDFMGLNVYHCQENLCSCTEYNI